MDFEEIKQQWFAAKSGILEESDLTEVGRDDDYIWYECPCGGSDHNASRAFIREGYSKFPSTVLNCLFSGERGWQQWLIRPVDVAAVIRGEEEKYLALLKRAEPTVRKIVAKRGWSDETATFLKDTHGIDREIAESFVESET